MSKKEEYKYIDSSDIAKFFNWLVVGSLVIAGLSGLGHLYLRKKEIEAEYK